MVRRVEGQAGLAAAGGGSSREACVCRSCGHVRCTWSWWHKRAQGCEGHALFGTAAEAAGEGLVCIGWCPAWYGGVLLGWWLVVGAFKRLVSCLDGVLFGTAAEAGGCG